MQRIFIGLAFIAFSFLFFWLVAGKPLGQWSEVASWTEVPAKIMEVELMKHRDDAYAAMFNEMFGAMKDAGENQAPDLPKRGGKKNKHGD